MRIPSHLMDHYVFSKLFQLNQTFSFLEKSWELYWQHVYFLQVKTSISNLWSLFLTLFQFFHRFQFFRCPSLKTLVQFPYIFNWRVFINTLIMGVLFRYFYVSFGLFVDSIESFILITLLLFWFIIFSLQEFYMICFVTFVQFISYCSVDFIALQLLW